MKKIDEIQKPDSCLNKSADDEPLFVLCGRDMLAAEVVRFWAWRAKLFNVHQDKIEDALKLAERMENFQPKKKPD